MQETSYQRRFICFLALTVLLLSLPTMLPAQHAERRFQPEYFERADRDQWQKPDEVVQALGLKSGDDVADIGAGSGYFTRRFATAVAPSGAAFAIDIDERMLRFIQQRAEKDDQHNIVTILSPTNDPMLAPASVDLIFLCNTIHHIFNRSDYYRRMQRGLRTNGRVAIVDFEKKPLPVNAPPLQERIAKEDMIQEMTDAGFKLEKDLDLLPYQYFLIFRYPEKASR